MDQLQSAIDEIARAYPNLSRAEVEAMVAEYMQTLRSEFTPEQIEEMRKGAQSFVIHAVYPLIAEVARRLGRPPPEAPGIERACLTVGAPPALFLAIEARPAGESAADALEAVDAVVPDPAGRARMREELGRLLASAINQYLQELEALVAAGAQRELVAPYASAIVDPQTTQVQIAGVPGFPLGIGVRAVSAEEARAMEAAKSAEGTGATGKS